MKTIQPVSVWYNGQQKQANVLLAAANNDNLKDSASFSYQLISVTKSEEYGNETFESLVNGNLIMKGEAYDNWETNDYAYSWVAQQLNLTITGDYIPPTPTPEPTPTPTPEPSQIL